MGCHDQESTSPKIIQTPSGPMLDLGTVIVDVDMKTGTAKVHPLSSATSLPPGVSARFFGKPNTEIEYHFSGQPQGFPAPGVVEYNLHGGFANLLPFAIGTNSPHSYPSLPQDTMGVYVYYVYPPYSFTSGGNPCSPPACDVTVDSADGAYPFTTGTPQLYQYWKTILQTGGLNAQGPGPFETAQDTLGGINYYRPFSFRTIGAVSTFSFGVAMAAAWVDPNENRWKVFYLADSLPDRVSLFHLRSEPDWRRLGTTGSSVIAPGGCAPNTGACKLTLTAVAGDSIIYYRSDSLRASQSGYITATVTASALTGTQPGVFLGLKDPVKLAQLGISTLLTGFTDSTGTLIPAYSVASDLSRTSYRVAKYGTDSASIFSPAGNTVALVTIPYASLPPAPVRGSGPPNYDRFFFFGNITASLASTTATSAWTNVNYEIGAAAP
jgi:hypothetical protein